MGRLNTGTELAVEQNRFVEVVDRHVDVVDRRSVERCHECPSPVA